LWFDARPLRLFGDTGLTIVRIVSIGIFVYVTSSASTEEGFAFTCFAVSYSAAATWRRPAHRRQWVTEALEPVRATLDRAAFDRLVGALSLCIGIEAHVTLRDVCGFSAAEARAIKTWTASALLGAATAGAPGGRKPATAKAPRTVKVPAKPKQRAPSPKRAR
jgi:hypothetical protein